MQALSRWLLALVLLLSLSCAGGDLGVLVTVEGWPVEALSLRVATSLNGTPQRVLQIPSGQDRFVVRLSPGESGELLLDATALDRGGCKVASGQLSISLGPSLHPTQEARLLLDRLPNILCTLTVEFTEGAGSVVSDPAGIQCTSAGTCEFNFPSGTSVQLLPSFDAKKQYVIWHGDCAGIAGCSLLMDRSHHVEVAFPGRICTPTGFCWQNPLPQGNSLSGVWVDPEGTAWTVGDNGTVLKCRGKSCTLLTSGAASSLSSLSGRSADEVWAVGKDGSVVKCGASSCTRIAAGTNTHLSGVWASRSGEVWAVGSTGTVVKCDGSSCAGLGSVTMNRLRSVAGSDSGEVWAVGDGGAVLKCGGSSCALISSGTSSDLYAVWVSSSGEAWAVGDQGTILQCGQSGCSPLASGRTDLLTGVSGSPSGAVFVHGVNGTLLKCAASLCAPLVTGTSSLLNKAWISPGGEVWVAGNNGDLLRCSGNSCALLPSGKRTALNWIAGGSAGEVWAVGDGGALTRCSGGKCLLLSSGEVAELYSIYGSASGDVWAAGTRLIRCSGGSCLPGPRNSNSLLTKITGNASGQIWAVGELSTLLKCDNDSCSERSIPLGELWIDVFVNQAGFSYVRDVNNRMCRCNGFDCLCFNLMNQITSMTGRSRYTWMGGDKGYLIRFDANKGETFMTVSTGTLETLTSLWLSGSEEVWAVARRSLLRCDATSCSSLPMVATDDLHAVAGTGNGEVWAVGKAGNVIKCSGASCSLIPKATDEELRRVAGDDRGGVWVVAGGSSVLSCSGTSCSKVPLHGVSSLTDLWVSGAGEVWVIGHGGTILRYAP